MKTCCLLFAVFHRDWSIVHLMGMQMLPSMVIVPAKPQVAHIGKCGLHGINGHRLRLMKDNSQDGLLPFLGTSFQSRGNEQIKPRKGHGGWGHPADHEHCIKLFGATPTFAD
jgi:hypothetical protein